MLSRLKKLSIFAALAACIALGVAHHAHAQSTTSPPAMYNQIQRGIPFSNVAVTTVVQIKATRADLRSLSVSNNTAAAAFLQVFCKPSASVTLGTTAPDFVVQLKTNAGAGDERDIPFPIGVCYVTGTGLSVAGTTTATGSSTASIQVFATYF